jgi:hypothetical protein
MKLEGGNDGEHGEQDEHLFRMRGEQTSQNSGANR